MDNPISTRWAQRQTPAAYIDSLLRMQSALALFFTGPIFLAYARPYMLAAETTGRKHPQYASN